MRSAAGSFDTLIRAVQAVADCAAETSSAAVHASKPSSTMAPQLLHLDPIDKLIAGVPHRKINAGKEEDEVKVGSVEQGKPLVLPRNPSAPLDSWRVTLPVIPVKDPRRSLSARRYSNPPISCASHCENKVHTSRVLPALPLSTQPSPSQSRPTQVSRAQQRIPGALVIPPHPRQPSFPTIGRGDLNSAVFPHHNLTAPLGAPNWHIMSLAAHSHPHNQPKPRSSQQHYPLMPPLPTRPHSSFPVPSRPITSGVIRNAHPHARPPTVSPVGRSSSGASRALSREQEKKRIEALIHTQNVSRDSEYSREELVKKRKRILNRASVQKCRRKKREREIRLEKERALLIHDNDILRRAKVHMEQSSFYNIVRLVQRAEAEGLDPAAVVAASFK